MIVEIEGYSVLQNILDEASFTTFNECKNFIDIIIAKLKVDEREGKNNDDRFIS